MPKLACASAAGVAACAAAQEAVITGGLHELYPLLDLVFLAFLALLVLLGWAVGRPWALLMVLVVPVSASAYVVLEGRLELPLEQSLRLAPLCAMLIGAGVLLRRLAGVDSGSTTGGLAGSGLR